MAVNWFASLKDVPWSKVIGTTPSIVESGRKLWERISNRQVEEGSTVANPAVEPLPTGTEALAALEIRIRDLEKNRIRPLEHRTAQLREEVVSSFDVVRSIVNQHSDMVHAVDVLLVRTQLLVRISILLGIACVALFVLVLSR